MKRIAVLSVIIVMIVIAAGGTVFGAPQKMGIDVVLQKVQDLTNTEVAVEGAVANVLVLTPVAPTDPKWQYDLIDKLNNTVQIRTKVKPPAAGEWHEVVGVVKMDPTNSTPFIYENNSSALPTTNDLIKYAAIALLAIVAIVLIILLARPKKPAVAPAAPMAAAPPPPPAAAPVPPVETKAKDTAAFTPPAPAKGTAVYAPVAPAKLAVVFSESKMSAGEFALKEGRQTIGRAGADITIDDETVSKEHAVIEWANGTCRIENKSTTNGTLVNDVRISEATALKDKDTIQMGSTKLRFELKG